MMLQRPFVFSVGKVGFLLTPHVRFLNASVGFGGSCFQKAAGFSRGDASAAVCWLCSKNWPLKNDGCNSWHEIKYVGDVEIRAGSCRRGILNYRLRQIGVSCFLKNRGLGRCSII